jgi:hypothetical protein
VEGSAFSIRGASKTGALAFEMWDAATNQVSPQGWPFRIKQHSFAGFFSKYQSAQGRSKAARCMRRIFIMEIEIQNGRVAAVSASSPFPMK